VPKRPLILDPSEYDLNHIVADIEDIRRYNRQRYEMEQLTAVVFEDAQRCVCVGYKDLTPNEFWVRGHMPGIPLMPGVVMIEAAAQLASYYTQKYKLMDAPIIGFGGLKDVRFRGVVRPGDRFVVVAKLLKVRSAMLTCEFQCLVRDNLVCEGVLMGIPLNEDAITARQA
jgi:3-hydroxyacyl-[acyl-carrier-protein] dehydratase